MTPTFTVFQGATVEKVMGGRNAPPPQIGLNDFSLFMKEDAEIIFRVSALMQTP